MISVCIPTYNQANYIEIIISNDASTDHTKNILDKLLTRVSNLCVVNQPINLGMSKNTDVCLRAAKGNIIVKLDSDDYLYPDYIKELSSLLNKYPEAGYAHANVHEVNEEGNIIKVRSLFRTIEYQSSEDALKSALKGYRVAANIIMFRKEALQKVGYIQSYQNFAEDYFLSVAMADNGFGNIYCNKILSGYRVWSDAGQVRQKRKLAEINGLDYVFKQGIVPAFAKRKWNLHPTKKAQENFACAQADCLGWSIYNETEKKELKQALLQLSNSKKTKAYIWAYLNGYGSFLQLYKNSITDVKKVIKKLLVR